MRALHGFEAAARLLSFTAAASELNLTQGAISRQIRDLEELLGVPLFRRSIRRIELTLEGEEYAAAIRPLLTAIAQAGAGLRHRALQKTLTISVLPTLASHWLMPRLHSFAQTNPELEVRMVSSIEPADHLAQPGQIAIRVGALPGQRFPRGRPRINLSMVTNWEGVDADLLFDDTLMPVCSAALFADGPIPGTAAELVRYPLIHTSTRRYAWPDWLNAQGVQLPPGGQPSLEFGHFFMSLEAARRGRGVALLPYVLLQDVVGRDDLIIPSTTRISSAGDYYLLSHENNRGDPSIDMFRNWIHRETGSHIAGQHSPVV